MSDSMSIGAAAMQAQQLSVDTIANNLANVNTPGFKKARVNFTDLVTVDTQAPDVDAAMPGANALRSTLAGLALRSTGMGVGVAGTPRMFDAGAVAPTGSMWDLAINGDGFLQVTMPDGTTQYARGGTLTVNADGVLATQSGLPLKPALRVPANMTGLSIASDGTVTATVSDQSKPIQLGQLQLARFVNPTGLAAQGDNRYAPTDASGEPSVAIAGQEGNGTLQQAALEGSNVKLVDEMVNLMIAQRAYEANTKIVQASDEIESLVNNLRK